MKRKSRRKSIKSTRKKLKDSGENKLSVILDKLKNEFDENDDENDDEIYENKKINKNKSNDEILKLLKQIMDKLDKENKKSVKPNFKIPKLKYELKNDLKTPKLKYELKNEFKTQKLTPPPAYEDYDKYKIPSQSSFINKLKNETPNLSKSPKFPKLKSSLRTTLLKKNHNKKIKI
jgi:hypothetical protein